MLTGGGMASGDTELLSEVLHFKDGIILKVKGNIICN